MNCPTPHKQGWFYVEHADAAKRANAPLTKSLRVYLCDCDMFHLTSTPDWRN